LSEIQKIRTEKQKAVFADARIKAREQAIRTGQYAEMGRKGGAILFEKKLGLFARTPETISTDARQGGKIAGALAAATPGHLSRAGSLGGKIGGAVQGNINAANGWLQHIAFIRYQKSHNACRYCNPVRVSSLA
jgi:hypothetical protein